MENAEGGPDTLLADVIAPPGLPVAAACCFAGDCMAGFITWLVFVAAACACFAGGLASCFTGAVSRTNGRLYSVCSAYAGSNVNGTSCGSSSGNTAARVIISAWLVLMYAKC